MTQADDVAKVLAAPAADELTFHPEGNASLLVAAAIFFAVGATLVLLNRGFESTVGAIGFVLGIVLMLLAALALLPATRRYPRLRLSNGFLWLQGFWGPGRVLDLDELGRAHVVELRYRNSGFLHLGFLRRDEEQALLEAGQSIPTHYSAFYKHLPIYGLISHNWNRARDIADVINSRRNARTLLLTPTQRAEAMRRIGNRNFTSFVIVLALAVVAVAVAIILAAAR